MKIIIVDNWRRRWKEEEEQLVKKLMTVLKPIQHSLEYLPTYYGIYEGKYTVLIADTYEAGYSEGIYYILQFNHLYDFLNHINRIPKTLKNLLLEAFALWIIGEST